jgi:agmatine deiminase
MCWPCRETSWGHTLEQGRREFAAVANAIAAFEPVTMVARNPEQAAQARAMLAGNVDVVVRPIDGSWLRDNGPLFVTDTSTRRARHFRFNAWSTPSMSFSKGVPFRWTAPARWSRPRAASCTKAATGI